MKPPAGAVRANSCMEHSFASEERRLSGSKLTQTVCRQGTVMIRCFLSGTLLGIHTCIFMLFIAVNYRTSINDSDF
jgi:hypothetical protein